LAKQKARTLIQQILPSLTSFSLLVFDPCIFDSNQGENAFLSK